MTSRNYRLGAARVALVAGCAMLSMLSAAQPATAAGTLRFTYEDGRISSGTALEVNKCCGHSLGIKSLARTGKYAVMSQVRYGDPAVEGGVRAESHTLRNTASHFRSGSTAYYGFSIYIPSTWQKDSREDIVFQWKPWRDTCEAQKWPSAFLTVQPTGKFQLRVNSDAGRCSTAESLKKDSYDLTDVQPGRWHDFVFRIRWSHGDDGAITGWHQTHKTPGWKRVVSATGANTFNDDATTKGYLKWGLYKPAWNTAPTLVQERVIFHDNVAVGASFNAVNPAKN
ncbi:polysaccharide lyase [Nonomuraea sp. NPDC050404]|uniref:polysaccharide lyase n=1 Tax=Nonomuraea sp. NPDC050404 TaxID=3155783 RepID=UPI0033E84AC4